MNVRVQRFAQAAKFQNYLKIVFVMIHAETDTMINQAYALYVLRDALYVLQTLVAVNVHLYINLFHLNV